MDIVTNAAKGRHLAIPTRDKDGASILALVLKYTFRVSDVGTVEPLFGDAALQPDLVDTYNGEDAATASIRRPSQLFEYKPGTEVILLGHAFPRRGGATSADVALSVGPIQKTLRAYGLRVWQRGVFGGVSPGPARPITEPVPLIYELAWGGSDTSDPARPKVDPRNPVGRGVGRDPRDLVDRPAAVLEDLGHPLDGPKPKPVSFGALHRHWQPRASFVGTYDEDWLNTRMPLLPFDFDPRFHVSAPPDQWSETPLRSDTRIEVLGATDAGHWSFQLPRLSPGFSSYVRGVRSDHHTHLDTILLDADLQQVELTFRAAIPIPPKLEMFDAIQIVEKRVV